MMGIPEATPTVEPMRNYRPYSLGQPHDMRARLLKSRGSDGSPREGLLIYGMGFCSPDIARMIGAIGYDMVFM